MSDELIDQVDENDEIIGSIFKSQAHQNPSLIHREVAIVVFNKKGEVLLQQKNDRPWSLENDSRRAYWGR